MHYIICEIPCAYSCSYGDRVGSLAEMMTEGTGCLKSRGKRCLCLVHSEGCEAQILGLRKLMCY